MKRQVNGLPQLVGPAQEFNAGLMKKSLVAMGIFMVIFSIQFVTISAIITAAIFGAMFISWRWTWKLALLADGIFIKLEKEFRADRRAWLVSKRGKYKRRRKLALYSFLFWGICLIHKLVFIYSSIFTLACFLPDLFSGEVFLFCT